MQQTVVRQQRAQWPAYGIYGLTLLVLVLAVPFPVLARKLFFLACCLAAVAWACDRQRPTAPVLGVLATLAIFAFYRTCHTVLEAGTVLPNIDAWQAYLASVNRLAMGLFLIGYLSTRVLPATLRTLLLSALALALLLCLVSAGWQEFVLSHDRGAREQRATLFAYEVVAVYFAYLGLQLTRMVGSRWQWLLLAVVSVVALWVVLWTETRSALLCFFVGGALLVLLSERVRKWRVLGMALVLGAAMLAAGYQDFVKPRLLDAESDIVQYISGENRDTSIGARLELWKGSMLAFSRAPWWGGGYLQREAIIKNAVAQNTLDPVAAHFSSVNMHNELLEELSLRGLVGGVLLLAVYGMLLWTAMARQRRHLALLGLVFAYVFFGLSDVLFFSREATLVFMVLLAVLLMPSSATPQLEQRSSSPTPERG